MSGGRITAARVRVEHIDFHAHNVRVDLGDLRQLADSMADVGLRQPVVLERRGARLRVQDGHRRVAAARMLDWLTIPALVHEEPLDDDEWLKAAVHVNTRRKDMEQRDRVRAAQSMRDAGVAWSEIARDFGVSTTTVRKWLDPTDTPAKSKGPGQPRLPLKRLGTFTAEARDRIRSGAWTAEQLLDALDRLASTGTLTAALADEPREPP